MKQIKMKQVEQPREIAKERILMKFEVLSEKHHQLSILMHNLGKSLRIENRNKGLKELKASIKNLNLDFEKLEKVSNTLAEFRISDFKKELEK